MSQRAIWLLFNEMKSVLISRSGVPGVFCASGDETNWKY
jgi:hypothetical protein